MSETALRSDRPVRRLTVDMRALSPFIALAVLIVAGVLVNPDFLTASNLLNVVTRSAFIAIIAVGATFVIAGGGLDLSVGAMAAFVAGVMILVLNSLGSAGSGALALGILAALALSAACGLANGLIVPTAGSNPSS
jgi:ribose transport system permease protein